MSNLTALREKLGAALGHPGTRRRGAAWMVVIAAVLVLLRKGPQPIDDAFITLRYARSLAEGDGFVWNPGEHVLGTTTPLFALLLSALKIVSRQDLVAIAFGVALLAHGAAVVWIQRSAEEAGYVRSGWLASALYAISPLGLGTALSCMETSLFIATSLYALRFRDGTRPSCSVAAAAALLLRPEGVLVALLHFMRALLESRRSAARVAIVLVLCTLPWLLFAFWYFGSPVPQSLLAKAQHHGIFAPFRALENFWFVLVSAVLPSPVHGNALEALVGGPFGELVAKRMPFAGYAGARAAVLLIGGAVLLAAVAGSLVLRKAEPGSIWLFAFVALYSAAFIVRNPLIFPWYLVPPLPALLLATVVGASNIGERYFDRYRSFAAMSASLPLFAIAFVQMNRLVLSFPSIREQAYREAVERLGAPAQRRSVLIGALEAGTIGYYSRARVLDHFGLVSPEALKYDRDALIAAERPDYYIVDTIVFNLLGFKTVASFGRDYKQTSAIVTGPYQAVATYVRRARP